MLQFLFCGPIVEGIGSGVVDVVDVVVDVVVNTTETVKGRTSGGFVVVIVIGATVLVVGSENPGGFAGVGRGNGKQGSHPGGPMGG